ncbi:MAG TPA: hypothetical protein VGW98_10415 [Solirubrobacteraceae bacterium]|nr:hypothetical protein [Solirubrobacteraceae bacterium]
MGLGFRVVIALATLALPTAAWAVPTVTVRGRAVPIPGFPHTGNFFGAGAAVQAKVSISGKEYGGFPPPLIGINTFLPAGVHLNTHAFPTCPVAAIMQQREPRLCPKGSSAGPPGRVSGVVAFGKELVREEAEILSFFAPGGGFEFLTLGHSPVLLEVPTLAQLHHPGGAGGFGPEFTAEIPLVVTVPGAQDASVETIEITLGAALRRRGKPVYYGTVPRTCPHGGFRVKAEFIFAGGGDTSQPETVTVPFRAPCPTR